MVIKTATENGLLLWLGRNKGTRTDYISIAIVGGYAQFSYKLGKQNNTLYMTSKVGFNKALRFVIVCWFASTQPLSIEIIHKKKISLFF